MMVGCIPVILANEIEFPFENSLHWPSLTVKIAEADCERVLEILHAIPPEQIAAKQAAAKEVLESELQQMLLAKVLAD
jgi:hypothetical protein